MPANGIGGQQQAAAGNVPAGYVVNEPKPIANPRGEGTYKMVGPKGQTVLVPFSDVRLAEDLHYQVVGDPADSKTDAGRYKRDAAAIAPSLLHSLEGRFGLSPAELKAKQIENRQHPVEGLADATGAPEYVIPKWVVQQTKQSYEKILQAVKDHRSGNRDAVIVDSVGAVPLIGPGMAAAAEEAPVSTGSYRQDFQHVIASGPVMGTLLGTSFQTALMVDGLRGSSSEGGGAPPPIEGAVADVPPPSAVTPPVDTSPSIEGASAATPPADADVATEPMAKGSDDGGSGGGVASAATPPVESGSASEAGEAASAMPPVDASTATSPIDAAATPAPADASTFESSFSQIKQAIKDSELGQRAPRVLQDAVQTIFQGDSNFRLLTPGRIVEVPPDQFFLQPTQIQEELQHILIDPTTGKTMGAQPGLEVFPQGSGGDGLVKPPGAPVESTPATLTSEGAGRWVRVGRWMSQQELDKMKASDTVQESTGGGGGSWVAFPSDANAYPSAKPGSLYVEYDVPAEALAPGGSSVWRRIPGPNSLEGRLAVKKGQPAPQLPPVKNIEVIQTK